MSPEDRISELEKERDALKLRLEQEITTSVRLDGYLQETIRRLDAIKSKLTHRKARPDLDVPAEDWGGTDWP